jgi:TetR/AcrR family transcriptional regulator, fatty acid metabolism regulator protein
LVNRAGTQEDKRRLILSAAVRVFAEKGYHAARVGDIAEEAGVAYGLLYHYFGSKDEVLSTVFRETWGMMLGTVRSVEEVDESARDRLRKVAAVVLRAWKRTPDLVRVLVTEVTRSELIQREVEEIDQAFAALERIIRSGQEAGEFRPDLDPRLAAWILYGALDEFLTGWAFGQLPDSDEDVEAAIRSVVEVVGGGLAVERAPALQG